MCHPANTDAAARAALESAAARPLTDAEWERARTRLVEFVSILRSGTVKRRRKNAKAAKLSPMKPLENGKADNIGFLGHLINGRGTTGLESR
jgi:hypothetical protein